MRTTPQTGPISSVPVLQEASQLALATVNASKKIRCNKAAFKRLANEASELVDDMIHFHRMIEKHFPQGVPEHLAVVFQSTVDFLNSIQSFTRDVASKNLFMAFLFSRSDMKEIRMHDQTLAMKKGSFKIISNTCVEDLLTKSPPETLETWAQRFRAASGIKETK